MTPIQEERKHFLFGDLTDLLWLLFTRYIWIRMATFTVLSVILIFAIFKGVPTLIILFQVIPNISLLWHSGEPEIIPSLSMLGVQSLMILLQWLSLILIGGSLWEKWQWHQEGLTFFNTLINEHIRL